MSRSPRIVTLERVVHGRFGLNLTPVDHVEGALIEDVAAEQTKVFKGDCLIAFQDGDVMVDLLTMHIEDIRNLMRSERKVIVVEVRQFVQRIETCLVRQNGCYGILMNRTQPHLEIVGFLPNYAHNSLHAGDIIVSVNNKSVTTAQEFISASRSTTCTVCALRFVTSKTDNTELPDIIENLAVESKSPDIIEKMAIESKSPGAEGYNIDNAAAANDIGSESWPMSAVNMTNQEFEKFISTASPSDLHKAQATLQFSIRYCPQDNTSHKLQVISDIIRSRTSSESCCII